MAYMLSRQDERDLITKIKEGDEAALEKLVLSNAGFVRTLAANYQQSGIDMGDLIQEGMLGLIEAAKEFDLEYENKFITFAYHHIKKRLSMYVILNSNNVKTPVDVVWMNRKRKQLENKFYAVNGRMPSDEELMDILGISESNLARANSVRNKIVFLDSDDEDGKPRYHEQIMDEMIADPLDAIAQEELRQIIAQLLEMLPDGERKVLKMAYLDDMSLTDIANELGITKQAVYIRKFNGLRRCRAKVNFKKELKLF